MSKKFRDQLLAENQKGEEEVKNVNLEIEEREVSENGPFVLIRNINIKIDSRKKHTEQDQE